MITFRRHSPQGRKGEPRRGWLARWHLIGITIIVSQLLALEPVQAANKSIYKQYAFMQLNYNFKEFYCLSDLWYKESRWIPTAKNPKSSAYGIAQLLKTKTKDPYIQIQQGLKYIEHRYQGSACKALAFHKKKGWY
jgi:hypothetical protein